MNKYNIRVSGYGSELTIGTITESEKEIINSSLNDGLEMNEILQFDVIGKDWFEFDDVFHRFSVSDNFRLVVSENDDDILEFTSYELMDKYVNIFEYTTFENDESVDLVICDSQEKGLFAEYEFEANKFEISKLKIFMIEDVGIGDTYNYGDMVQKILYDGEELEDSGASTNGKSFEIFKNF